jgi:tetratricopeptide (TPR) repeat protein
MHEESLFPSYIARPEERRIRREAQQVRRDGKSRVVLLYGPGGVGKTWLVRQLAQASAADSGTIWLDPIDIDDPEYWLLSNLERQVAQRLDPASQHFGPYLTYLSQLPRYTRPRIGHETVVSHLGRIKRVFVECYQNFVEDSGQTVVIVFDTVEAIRGMYLLLTLTQWMKALPGTLFILSGRPLPGDRPDPIKSEFDDPYQRLPVTTVRLGEFTQAAALRYLDTSSVAAGVSAAEKTKLVHLTRGHPLWLAFTIDYLAAKGIPEEAEAPLAVIERDVPYRGTLTPAGESLQEAFKRRLVAPYRETDFWHEALKRLAVIRQSVNRPIWQRLMADRPLPPDTANLAQAWEALLQTPWIRPRANRRQVTLHDAVAEELARRIIPLHDQDKQWRLTLWRRTVGIYDELTHGRAAELAGKLAILDESLQILDQNLLDEGEAGDGERRLPPAEESRFIQDAARLDAQKRELYQLRAVRLYYLTLSDFAAGCREFVDLLELAKSEHDVLFEDLLAFEMQRFLPGGVHPYAFGDVIGGRIDEFRDWLSPGHPQAYLEVGLSMADYLIDNEQPRTAIELLDRLPEANAGPGQRYRLNILRGNAYMRVPGRVQEGLRHFRRALEDAAAVQTPDRRKLVAEAHRELGYYYRNEGLWQEADDAYRQAREVISSTLSARSSDDDREELASIQTHWAYVKGLSGSYSDGASLAESAITMRHRLNRHQAEGNSWSVCGEVYRYERRFQKAWDAYAEAERIFQGQRNWSWLGLVYQEQAICLFQATHDGMNLTPGRDPIEQAKRLITLALDICRDQAVRAYPSALNRAGRIYGAEDPGAGLRYFTEGIDSARRLSDGWYWFANLIEYAELSYHSWQATGRGEHLANIADRAADIRAAMSEYAYPGLRGRWYVLQGHLGIHDWLDSRDDSRLNAAIENYKDGFALIAQTHVGSSGPATVAAEFKIFGDLLTRLPPDIRAQCQDELRRAWGALEDGSILLLARLEELY